MTIPSITRIHTPHEGGFNGASIETEYGRLLVYRWNRHRMASCFLDSNFQPIDSSARDHPELDGYIDPRVTVRNGRMYLLVHSVCRYKNGTSVPNTNGLTLDLVEATFESDGINRFSILAEFWKIGGWQRQWCEKNWLPFWHQHDLYFVQSIEPHRILRFHPATRTVALCHETSLGHPLWRFRLGGEFRGSAQPVKLADCYLSTFHTFRRGFGYYTGFYTFSPDPPFEILAASPGPVLLPGHATGKNLHSGRNGCIFVVQMEIRDHLIRLFAGNNGHSCVRIEIDLDYLLQTLVSARPASLVGTIPAPLFFNPPSVQAPPPVRPTVTPSHS